MRDTDYNKRDAIKLIVQIPCYNEAETIRETLEDVPQDLEGIDEIEILLIDDGSTDETVQIAEEWGVDHIVQFAHNKGLAQAFHTGLQQCLRQGADLIVNMDGDHAFRGEDLPRLIAPVLSNNADIVVGERTAASREKFSYMKRLLHSMGSAVVRLLSNTNIPDVTCGFRAYSREAALRLNVVSEFTYTLETIIQAGTENLSITSVPIETNPPKRDPRLYSSHLDYVRKSINTIIRMFITYKPLKFFSIVGTMSFTAGFLLGCRYLYLVGMGSGGGHIPSLLLSSVLLIFGVLVVMTGLMADVIRSNRKLIEEVLYLQRKSDVED